MTADVMNKKCIAMLLAGGKGTRLRELTSETAKPAVGFGGKYRLIDFPLSNCVNSGIDTVGVLTQYQPLELAAYIGSGNPWDRNKKNLDAQSRGFAGCGIYDSYRPDRSGNLSVCCCSHKRSDRSERCGSAGNEICTSGI